MAQDADTLKALLPDLVSKESIRMHSFGAGLADGCSNKQELFNVLRDEIEKTPPEKRHINILLGFLSSSAESDLSFYNSTLDALIGDEVLGQWFPVFQTTTTIDQGGLERLHKALDLGKAPINSFQCLAWGRAHESINDDELARLLKRILSKEGGIDVVLEILQMRFHGRNKESSEYSGSLMAVARDVLSIDTFNKARSRQGHLDYILAEIASICLKGKEGVSAAKQMGQHLAKAIMDDRIYAFDVPNLLNKFAQIQPLVFLNVFIGNSDIKNYQRKRMFADDFERSNNPLNQISEDELLSWCDEDPENRYPLIASAIQTFTESAETKEITWRPIVYSIFEKAPNLGVVLEHLADAIMPMAWSGSLSDILQKRSVLFQSLYQNDNAEIRAWAKAQHFALQGEIKRENEWEENRNRERNERFE